MIPICLSEKAGFLLLPRDTHSDPRSGQDPTLSMGNVTQECSCSQGCVNSPTPQSQVHVLARVQPTQPDVSTVPTVLILQLEILAWPLLPKRLDTGKKKKSISRTFLISSLFFKEVLCKCFYPNLPNSTGELHLHEGAWKSNF